MNIKDGHVHTNYCPHGTPEPIKNYIERAIQLGYRQITFTEHAPLPKEFNDPAPTSDSSMAPDQLLDYIQELKDLKKQYQSKIQIKIGLEVDYIEGWEKSTKEFLDEVGPMLDDMILSVHFLRHDNKWFCIDFSDKEFANIVQAYDSVDSIYLDYYRTLEKSILCDLGRYKPKRIGHISLVSKFQKIYPSQVDSGHLLFHILKLIKNHGYELDVNTAGLFKPYCEETYPPLNIIREAAQMNIPLVYGSDAHHPSNLGRGLEVIRNLKLNEDLI